MWCLMIAGRMLSQNQENVKRESEKNPCSGVVNLLGYTRRHSDYPGVRLTPNPDNPYITL